MENNISLSIIIPAYNAQNHIKSCLDSLLYECNNSTMYNHMVEIIIIDDGSTDETFEIANSYSKFFDSTYINLNVVSQINSGVSQARNTGLFLASGKYIFFLDADDCLRENSLTSIFSDIEKNYDFCAYSHHNLFMESGKQEEVSLPVIGDNIDKNNTADFIMYSTSSLNECWGKLFKNSIIKEHQICFQKGIKSGEDLLFVMEYYTYAKTISFKKESILNYRIHSQSAMHGFNVENRMKFNEYLYSYYLKYITNKNDDLKKAAYVYHFRIMTDLFRTYSIQENAKKNLTFLYGCNMSKDVISKLKFSDIPLYKRLEYLMMKYKLITLSLAYYKLKAKGLSK